MVMLLLRSNLHSWASGAEVWLIGDSLLASFEMSFSPVLVALTNVLELHLAGYFHFKCSVFSRELFVFLSCKWRHWLWFTVIHELCG